MENPIKNFICISNYFKGNDFLINLKKLEEGDALTTSESLLIEPLTDSHFLIVQVRK